MSQDVIIVEAEDADLVRALAGQHDVRADPVVVRGLDPVTTVTFVLLGAATAVATVVQLLEKHKGGQVIDLRPGAPRTLYRTPDVVYGLVVVIAGDGRVTVEVKEPKDMFGAVVEALQHITVDLGKAGVEAVAAAAREQLGPSATVTVDVTPDADRPPAPRA